MNRRRGQRGQISKIRDEISRHSTMRREGEGNRRYPIGVQTIRSDNCLGITERQWKCFWVRLF